MTRTAVRPPTLRQTAGFAAEGATTLLADSAYRELLAGARIDPIPASDLDDTCARCHDEPPAFRVHGVDGWPQDCCPTCLPRAVADADDPLTVETYLT